jgi:hypothetical protein
MNSWAPLKSSPRFLERHTSFVANALNGADDADSYEARDQGIFNSRRSGVAGQKPGYDLHSARPSCWVLIAVCMLIRDTPLMVI